MLMRLPATFFGSPLIRAEILIQAKQENERMDKMTISPRGLWSQLLFVSMLTRGDQVKEASIRLLRCRLG
ncbi:hypothetical protein DESC_40004 [Desulfosarcina cetonica]|nr:hypothetical protein DESC_40004 [Desulfosarcina cetonica]